MKIYIYFLALLLIVGKLSARSDSIISISDRFTYDLIKERVIDTTAFIDLSKKQTNLSVLEQDFWYNGDLFLLYSQSDQSTVFRNYITEPDSINEDQTNITRRGKSIIFIDKINNRCFKSIYDYTFLGTLMQQDGKYYIEYSNRINIFWPISRIEEISTQYPYQKLMVLALATAGDKSKKHSHTGDFIRIELFDKITFEPTSIIDFEPDRYNTKTIDYEDFLKICDELKSNIVTK